MHLCQIFVLTLFLFQATVLGAFDCNTVIQSLKLTVKPADAILTVGVIDSYVFAVLWLSW